MSNNPLPCLSASLQPRVVSSPERQMAVTLKDASGPTSCVRNSGKKYKEDGDTSRRRDGASLFGRMSKESV